MFSGPTRSILSLCPGGFRWDDGRPQVLPSFEPLVVTFIKGAVVLNQRNERFKGLSRFVS